MILFKAYLFFKDFQESPLNSSTFQACANPELAFCKCLPVTTTVIQFSDMKCSLFIFFFSHWRSSHNAFTHVRNKNSNIQGRSPYVDFPCHKELRLKERIRSLWEQIQSFKRISHYEKGRN